MTIEMDVGGTVYDLDNEITSNFTNFLKGYSYYFFVKASVYQQINVTFSLSFNNKTNPFIFSVSEYSSRYLTYINENKFNLKYLELIKGNELIASSTYLIESSSTKYLAFNITPNYNYDYIVAKGIISGGIFTVSNRRSTQINNILAYSSYYLCVSAQQFQKAIISLKINNINNNELPFNELNIYELARQKFLDRLKMTNQKLSTTISNNVLTASAEYEIISNSAEYIAFQFKSKSNIKSITSIIIVDGGFYISVIDQPQTILNLLPGFPYYFSIGAQNQTLAVKFSMSINDTKSLDEININEYSSWTQFENIRNENKYIPTIALDNELIGFITYKPLSYSTNCIRFKIIPKKQMEFITGTFSFLENNNPDSIFIIVLNYIFIALPIIVVIILLGYLLHNEYKNRSKEERKSEPLLP